MSQETSEWLNTLTLIGFADRRGQAWHYQAALQGTESNHYAGAIPVEDVRRRLFGWQVESRPVYIGARGEFPLAGARQDETRQAMVAGPGSPYPDEVFNIFKDGYVGHSYEEWLLDTVSNILDDTLGIGSAGLLRKGGQAWVQVEVPESIGTPEGVVFRPWLLAATSFDGSLATTFKRGTTDVVCDNTLQWGLGEKTGGKFKVKHTRYSGMRIEDARRALDIVFETADEFAAEVARLAQVPVTGQEFGAWLDILIPICDAQGRPLVSKSLTTAVKKHDQLWDLYTSDSRAAPWKGTALGAMKAYNTWQHHLQGVRGQSRVLRNREASVAGRFAKADNAALNALELVLAS